MIQIIDGKERKAEIIKKITQPASTATIPEVDPSTALLSPEIEIKIA